MKKNAGFMDVLIIIFEAKYHSYDFDVAVNHIGVDISNGVQ
jgi:hypothetical protein